MEKKISKEAEEKIFEQACKRLEIAENHWSYNVELAKEDISFRNGDGQWSQEEMADRQRQSRPTLTFNYMETFIDQVVGEQRKNKQSIKVIAADDKSFTKGVNIDGKKEYPMHDIYDGIIRDIEYKSRSDIAYETAFDHAVGHGFGFIRILTEYSTDDVFEQDIRIKRIPNSFSVLLDNTSTEPDGSDAKWGFISCLITKDEYEKKYGKDVKSFMHMTQDESLMWVPEDGVRIAEYFTFEEEKKILYLMSDQSTLSIVDGNDSIKQAFDAEMQIRGLQIVKERKCIGKKVVWYKLSGDGIIEGPTRFPGKYIPIIPVYGKELFVDGKIIYRGVIRHAKDAQRNYNYWETTATEQMALQPKAPIIATSDQVAGYENVYKTLNTVNHAWMPYNHIPGVPRPERNQPPQISSGFAERVQAARNNMYFTTGIHESGLFARSKETSGRAIIARQNEGDTGTFAFMDNLSRSRAQCGRILVSMIPEVVDTSRIMRMRHLDETEDFVEVNVILDDGSVVNDLSVGKYDVIVTTGPAFATRRQDSVQMMSKILETNPNLWQVIGDLFIKSTDAPGAEEMAERIKLSMPPEFSKGKDEKEVNPEETQKMQAEQQAQQQAQQQQKSMMDTQIMVAEIEAKSKIAKAESEIEKANISLQQSKVEMMKLEKEAKMIADSSTQNRVDNKKSEDVLELEELLK